MLTITTNDTIKGRGSAAAVVALLGGSLGGWLGSASAFGQDSGSVTVDVGECVELVSAADRLACFEAQVDAALGASAATESDDRVAEIQDPEIDEAQATRENPDTLPERRVARDADPRAVTQSRQAQPPGRLQSSENEEDEYFGTVTAFRERTPNTYVITLESGQVWEQTAAKWYPLRPGLQVRIYPSRWGGYRLTSASHSGHIQVRRVR